jgi:hypothetical protein
MLQNAQIQTSDLPPKCAAQHLATGLLGTMMSSSTHGTNEEHILRHSSPQPMPLQLPTSAKTAQHSPGSQKPDGISCLAGYAWQLQLRHILLLLKPLAPVPVAACCSAC